MGCSYAVLCVQDEKPADQAPQENGGKKRKAETTVSYQCADHGVAATAAATWLLLGCKPFVNKCVNGSIIRDCIPSAALHQHSVRDACCHSNPVMYCVSTSASICVHSYCLLLHLLCEVSGYPTYYIHRTDAFRSHPHLPRSQRCQQKLQLLSQ